MFLVATEQRVNPGVGVIDLLASFAASEDYFAGSENEEDDFWIYHAKDEAGEGFWVVITDILFLINHPCLLIAFSYKVKHFFQLNPKVRVNRSHNILNSESGQLDLFIVCALSDHLCI